MLRFRQMGLFEEHVSRRESVMFEEKDAIAAYAATMIRDDDFVYIDSGTTTACIIPHLKNTKATFVTNVLRTHTGCSVRDAPFILSAAGCARRRKQWSVRKRCAG